MWRNPCVALAQYCAGRALIPLAVAAQARWGLRENTLRKGVHIVAGFVMVGCWPLYGAEPFARWWAVLPVAVQMCRLLNQALSRASQSGARRMEEDALARAGETRPQLLASILAYLGAVAACTLGGWRTSQPALAALAALCAVDGSAALAGVRWGGKQGGKGRRRARSLPWNEDKTWPGLAGGVVGGTAGILAVLSWFEGLGYLPQNFLIARCALAARLAFAGALVESLALPVWLNDNITVPVAVACAAWKTL